MRKIYYRSLKECLNLPKNVNSEKVAYEVKVQRFEERMRELYLNTKKKENELNEEEK